ncbi:MAG TPA: lipopolysaccharide transport periplasmic protein LptA, partial [Verrucomicrobiae bacterium]|nr:lipopolysaccharide transport periplasmic protein LptA [Verrucomicrobiae bacterium]
VLLSASTVLAAAPKGNPPAERNSKPIFIKSDRFESDTQGNRVVFIGNVVAKQDDMTMTSDRMTVIYTPGGEDVERVESVGNVKIVQGARVGTGGKGVYENAKGTVTLTENPKIVQDKDTITGTVIVYDLVKERSTVTAAPDTRVEAVIHPRKKEPSDQRRP